MYAILIAFAVLFSLRLILERKHRAEGPQDLVTAVRAELRAWFVALSVLIGICTLFFVLALVVGPIPQIHEW